MLTWEKAEELYSRAKDKEKGKPIANNTILVKVDDSTFGVRLYSTYVVLIHKDGTYTLDSGGYKKKTTKERINEFSPVYVHQKDYNWFVGEEHFFNGMKLKKNENGEWEVV